MDVQLPPQPDRLYPPHPPTGPPLGYYQAPPPTRTMAWWALGLSLVPCLFSQVAAVALAITTLVRLRDNRAAGKRLAIAALVITVVWVSLLVAAFLGMLGDLGADRDAHGTVTGAGDVLASKLRTGDCIQDPGHDGAVLTIRTVPCAQPHDDEVFATFDLARGSFPGEATVSRLAEGGCAKRFESYVGGPWLKSKLDMFYMQPVESTWSSDRGVACLVTGGKDTTGSLRHSELAGPQA